jgi:hypothetical protein
MANRADIAICGLSAAQQGRLVASFLRVRTTAFVALAITSLLTSCSTPPPYQYRFVPGKSAILSDGVAVAPPRAPRAVHAAVAAGNRIAGSPYRYGGGHRRVIDSGYDCSGAVSSVLYQAGLLRGSLTSSGFRRYGQSGHGRWISVYARRDHTFLVIAGLRFDTGWNGRSGSGPRWTTRPRPTSGFVVRHPPGL